MTPIRRPLGAHTTIGLGGEAAWVEAADDATVVAAVREADARGTPLHLLGGGSNLVIADEGVSGVVLALRTRGVRFVERGEVTELHAAAGEPWDGVVAAAVERGLAGLECLSGIPGRVGAVPVQNVGAYGQEVADTLVRVRALCRQTGEVLELTAAECELAYRDSRFKAREPGRFILLGVVFALRAAPRPPRYAELARRLAERHGGRDATLAEVRAAVLALRREKSMVEDPSDPDARSCGSFFTNPILDAEALVAVEQRVRDRLGPEALAALPRWPQPATRPAGSPGPVGATKLPAAWLIERAGLSRGLRQGPVGLSTKHTLAITAGPGATARDVVAFAHHVRRTVDEAFGVTLVPEPVFWGFGALDRGLPVP